MEVFAQSGQQVGTQINIGKDDSNIYKPEHFLNTRHVRNYIKNDKILVVTVSTNKNDIGDLFDKLSSEFNCFIYYDHFKSELKLENIPDNIKIVRTDDNFDHICDIDIIGHGKYEIYPEIIKFTKKYE
jgi:hypothetical protein